MADIAVTELSKGLRDAIAKLDMSEKLESVGIVTRVGDGVAWVHGLTDAEVPHRLRRTLFTAGTAVAGDRGDRIDHRLDRKGDRIEHRLDARGDRIEHRFDRRAERADRNGHPRVADRLGRQGERIDARLDHKGERAEARWDRRGDRIDRRLDRRG